VRGAVVPGGFVYVESRPSRWPRCLGDVARCGAQGRAGAVHPLLQRRGYTAAADQDEGARAVTATKPLTAVYPGTFDPMTLGHEDLMRAPRGCSTA
jgi:hypothetical protein